MNGEILNKLLEQQLSITELSKEMNKPRATVYQRIKQLKSVQLVEVKNEGTENIIIPTEAWIKLKEDINKIIRTGIQYTLENHRSGLG